ncbi:MAG: DNA polymerase I [Victivallaceae bacterium]
MGKKLFLLDASGFVYRAYCGLPVMNSPKGGSVQAVFGFIRSLNKLSKDFDLQYLVAVFDGPDNKKSRHSIYSAYKANRILKYPDLPRQLELAKEYCRLSGIRYFDEPGIEADDVIASLTKTALEKDFEVYICTSDKDLCQLIRERVFLINPWKDNLITGCREVNERFGVGPALIPDYLALVGDASDNIPGVPGCGPKGATRLLNDFDGVQDLIANVNRIKNGKTRQLILDHSDQILLSRKLAVVDEDLLLNNIDDKDFLFQKNPERDSDLKVFYLKLGFKSLITNSFSFDKNSNPKCEIITTKEQADSLLSEWRGGMDIAVTTAYTGKILTETNPYGIAFSYGEEAWFLPKDLMVECLDSLRNFFRDTSIIFYENKYDRHALANFGINTVNVGFDVILAAYLLSSDRGRPVFSDLVNDFFPDAPQGLFIREYGKEGFPVTKTVEEPHIYFGLFAYYIAKLKTVLAEKLRQTGLNELFEKLELPLSSVLFDMEREGIFFDIDGCRALSRQIECDLARVTKEVYVFAGEEFNLKSSKQLGRILFEKLGLRKIKKDSTNVEVLEQLVHQHPIAAPVLEFRMLEKLRSSYLLSLIDCVDPKDGCIHCTFSQAVTATGRLACRDPNLQNIPVRTALGKKIREVFIPRTSGNRLLSADYSQIELRFLAHFSNDENLTKAFFSGEDIHIHTAAEVFEVSQQDVTSEQRRQAKAVNFGIVYGQQAFGLSKVLKIDLSRAQELIEAYFRKYTGLETFIKETLRKAADEGKVKTILGRERVIDGWSKFVDKAQSGRLAINTLLQGSAADLIKRSMLLLRSVIEKAGIKSKLLLQVHDELLFEAPEEELELLQGLVRENMEGALDLKVPLVVNILIGKNWSEC